MSWFRKPRRDVGRFVPPEEKPLTPLELVVADALKIAYHGVRMAVKNHLIVNALRDGKPFDEEELMDFARAEYARLAEANLDAADRAEEQLRRDEQLPSGRIFPGGKPVEVDERHRRTPATLRAVAQALQTTAVEASALTQLVGEAKVAAWDEVGGALASRLSGPRIEDDPEYLAFRDERIMRFIEEDLKALRPQEGFH